MAKWRGIKYSHVTIDVNEIASSQDYSINVLCWDTAGMAIGDRVVGPPGGTTKVSWDLSRDEITRFIEILRGAKSCLPRPKAKKKK